jgi:predicted DCC family thiol-disulfide oxidoreductase YuxK
LNNEKKIILFDGVCNFCNFWVNFVIKKDKKDLFRFAILQSEKAKDLTSRLNIDISNFDSFVLIVGEKFYIKSTAALMVCKELNSILKILFPLIVLPKIIRDPFYDIIAKNRYKLFGKRNICRTPIEAEKEKFLQ